MKLQEVPKRKMLPQFERFEPLVQDHSAIKLFKTCSRKYFWRIVLGYTAKKQGLETVFSWGTAYHKYREVLELEYIRLTLEQKELKAKYVIDKIPYTSLSEEKIREAAHVKATVSAIAVFKPAPLGVGGKWAHYTQANFFRMIGVARKWWEAEKNQKAIEVLGVEMPYNLMMPGGYIIGGRMDQFIRWNGRLWVKDFKTTSKKKEYFIKSLDPNDQATRYIYSLSKLHNQKVDGIYYEVAYTSNEGKKEQKVTKFQMYTFMPGRTESQLETWEREQDIYNDRLIQSRNEDIWPMNEDACSFCDYHPVCTKKTESAMGNTLKQMYLLKPWDHETVDQKSAEPED